MRNLSNNVPGSQQEKSQKILPFVLEFAKFLAGFSLLIAFALMTLRAATILGG